MGFPDVVDPYYKIIRTACAVVPGHPAPVPRSVSTLYCCKIPVIKPALDHIPSRHVSVLICREKLPFPALPYSFHLKKHQIPLLQEFRIAHAPVTVHVSVAFLYRNPPAGALA